MSSNKSAEILDDSYFDVVNIQNFPNLGFPLKIVLTLNHGWVAEECKFSVSKSVVDVKMQEETIVARRMVIDHKQASKLEPFLMTIGSELSLAVKKCFPERRVTSRRAKEIEKKTYT